MRLGQEVGYNVRFDRKMSDATRLAYYTDGMLLKEFLRRPNLSGITALIIDEAHERTADTDLILGLVKDLLKRRSDIRVIVMSATLDIEMFSKFFGHPPRIHVPGRMFPVTTLYTSAPVSDYVQAAVESAVRIHRGEGPGDVLVFLTGESEIERAVSKVSGLLAKNEAIALPLYGTLSMEDQSRVFRPAPDGARKIIFSTNIAETSLTIDGVVYVVDAMHHKESLHDVSTKVDCLFPTHISKASAMQRAGRAGRTRPGKCFRLMTEDEYNGLPDHSFPEMARVNVSSLILTLLRVGYTNPIRFPFITPPTQGAFIAALGELEAFGATECTEDSVVVSDMGKLLVEPPLSLPHAAALFRSECYGCARDVLVIVALLAAGGNIEGRSSSREDGVARRRRFMHPAGDYLTLFNVFHAFIANNQAERWCVDNGLRYLTLSQAVRIYTQLGDIMSRLNLPTSSLLNSPTTSTVNGVECPLATDRLSIEGLELLRRALVSGFYCQAAVMLDGDSHYTTVKTGVIFGLHKSSALMSCRQPLPKWIVYERLEKSQDANDIFARCAMGIDVFSLMEARDSYFDPSEIPNERVRALIGEAFNRFQEMYAAQTEQDSAANQPPQH